jgi:hypothetical protein
MLLTPGEIPGFITGIDGITSVHVDHDGRLQKVEPLFSVADGACLNHRLIHGNQR